jgi:DNA repair exonuclease SbcCD nuclease subunit
LKIIATADNHLGFKQYGLKQREKDIEDSFFRILELGVERGAAAVTVSGDLLHGIRPTSSTVSFLKKCQDYLVEHELPCLVSEGNHDKSTPHWISNVASDDETKGFVFLGNRSYSLKGYNIYGNSFTSKEDFDKGTKVPENTDLLLMHQQFCEFANFPNEKIFDCEDLINLTAPIVIVGDIHITDSFICRSWELSVPSDITVYSPGSSELMSAGESSKKYVYEIDTDSGDVDKIPIVTRDVMRVEVRSEEDVEQTLTLLQDRAEAGPLVYLKFDTTLPNVVGRFRKSLHGTPVILRPKPIMEYNGVEINVAQDAEEDLTLQDVLQELIPTNSSIYTPATQLLDSEADVVTILDTFVDNRMEGLKNADT